VCEFEFVDEDQIPSDQTAPISVVWLYRGADDDGCPEGEAVDCSWFDIDVEFEPGALPASVDVSCPTPAGSGLPAGSELYTVTLTSTRDELATGTDTELDRVCRWATPDYDLWVAVNGTASNTVNWEAREAEAPISVVWLYRGADDDGCPDGEAVDCSWLDIDVEFEPGRLPATVQVSCPNHDVHTVTLTSTRDELATGTDTELDRVCRWASPNYDLWVAVDDTTSNTITWEPREAEADQDFRDWEFLPDEGDGVTIALVEEDVDLPSDELSALVVRCEASVLEVFVHSPFEYVANETTRTLTASYKIHPAGNQSSSPDWSVSTDNFAIFSPKPISLARLIADNGGPNASILIDVDDELDDNVSLAISLNGAEDAVSHVLNACGV